MRASESPMASDVTHHVGGARAHLDLRGAIKRVAIALSNVYQYAVFIACLHPGVDTRIAPQFNYVSGQNAIEHNPAR